MPKILEQWILFEYVGGQLTPLSKPFKSRKLRNGYFEQGKPLANASAASQVPRRFNLSGWSCITSTILPWCMLTLMRSPTAHSLAFGSDFEVFLVGIEQELITRTAWHTII
jgi:hypothetical protein